MDTDMLCIYWNMYHMSHIHHIFSLCFVVFYRSLQYCLQYLPPHLVTIVFHSLCISQCFLLLTSGKYKIRFYVERRDKSSCNDMIILMFPPFVLVCVCSVSQLMVCTILGSCNLDLCSSLLAVPCTIGYNLSSLNQHFHSEHLPTVIYYQHLPPYNIICLKENVFLTIIHWIDFDMDLNISLHPFFVIYIVSIPENSINK